MKQQISFEFKAVILKRAVALTVFIVPLALIGLAFIVKPEDPAGWRLFAGLWSTLVVVFSVMFALPTVIADRRDRLVYKRLRTSSLSKNQIILAGVFPYLVIALFQVLVVGLSLSFLGGLGIERPFLLGLATIIITLAVCASGFALGSIAPSAERAQWTVLPVVLVVAISANFISAESIDDSIRTLFYILPGGAFFDLFHIAFGGDSIAQTLFESTINLSVVISTSICVVWTLIAAIAAKATFRWDAR